MSRTALRRKELTVERAREVLNYNPKTGELTWKKRLSNIIKVGTVAGCVHARSRVTGLTYRAITLDRAQYQAHRLAWFIYYGRWPTHEVGHKSGDGLDNRITNLREVSDQDVNKNKPISSSSSSGVIGVCWKASKQKWNAYITDNHKYFHLGYFDNPGDAILARKRAEKQYGFHPNHGRLPNTSMEKSDV